MSETLHLQFRSREDNSFELKVRESWSGHTVSSSFVPPYSHRQLNALQKKLDNPEISDQEQRQIGSRLFLALCGSQIPGTSRRESSEQSVQAVLRGVIQRTLRRRGTVALTLSFAPGCEEFVRYPWELLHNGEHFLIASGIFTLTRTLLLPDAPASCEWPVHPPMRILYISASPKNCVPIETERSFEALALALNDWTEDGRIQLDKLEQVTYDQLVEYLSDYGGANKFNDSETLAPCYVVHFDGHGAYGKVCPDEDCDHLNEANSSICSKCDASLRGIKAQTYLCFCDEKGYNRYIDTDTLRAIFVTSDVRLAVFSACETATLTGENTRRHRGIAFDSTLATALVMAQVPAVVAMPFSLQDDLSPTFMSHFYEALALGRTLEEALSRARHAMLPKHKHHGWFIPVLYRHVGEGQEGPVALLTNQEGSDDYDHPFAHFNTSTIFVGRERELEDLSALLAAAADEEQGIAAKGLRPGTHHIALTGPVGIGKSALAVEAIRRNKEKFPGGVIAVTLQEGKSFGEALLEIAHYLHIPTKNMQPANLHQRESVILNALRARASRELPVLLMVDGFDEVKEHSDVERWHRFLCSVPQEVVVFVTSRNNPATVAVVDGTACRWYEYCVDKMADADLLKLFTELAAATGLDQRIHLADEQQQTILHEICTQLDGYPLGAELIFGTAHSIGGKTFTPEATTRSLAEVRNELRETPLAGIMAVLEVAYLRLTLPARLLLSYLAAFKLPFSHEQIMLLMTSENLALMQDAVRLEREHMLEGVMVNGVSSTDGSNIVREAGNVSPLELANGWQSARDELVQSSFIHFDGRVYNIHSPIRHFALSYLPLEARRHVHRFVASYYAKLPQPGPEEWFAAFEHLNGAGEAQDFEKAVHVAVDASWALRGRGHAFELLAMLRRAEEHALRQGNKTGEGQIQCCVGAILRELGQYTEALACLTRSLGLHREQTESKESGWALYELAMLLREEGHFRQADGYAQEALQLFREVGDAPGEAWMQMVLGEVSRGYGNYYDALGHFDLALTIFRNRHNDEGCASTLRDRGTVYEALGQYSKALADYEEALRLFNALGLRAGQAWVLADQSVVYTDQGNLDSAERDCTKSIAIFREQRIRRGEGWALRAMGDIARERHQLNDARGYYEDALALFSALGDRVDQARVMNALGAISFDEQNYLAAREYYEQAHIIGKEQGSRQIEGRALRGLGDINCVMNRLLDAEHCYAESCNIATALDTPAERCAVLRRQGRLHRLQHHHQEALGVWVQALALDQRLGHPARTDLQGWIETLVSEHDLQEAYTEFSRQHGLS